jgi:hypothetical protein
MMVVVGFGGRDGLMRVLVLDGDGERESEEVVLRDEDEEGGGSLRSCLFLPSSGELKEASVYVSGGE